MPPSRLRRFLATAALVSLSSAAAAFPPSPARAAAATRIVSLMPSLTEDLFAIGAGTQVVGVSQFTDYPAAAKALPEVASFTSVDAERIATLHPDLIVGIKEQASLVGDLRRVGMRVELLDDDGFDDIFACIRRLGDLSGHAATAGDLVTRLHGQTAALVRRVHGRTRPRAFVVLGVAPIYTVGDSSYIAHLVELAGGRNASGVTEPYARYGAESVLAAQPDVLIADRQSGLGASLGAEPWRSLHAVAAKRVYILDDADILERPGPRFVAGLAWLIQRLHPDAAR